MAASGNAKSSDQISTTAESNEIIAKMATPMPFQLASLRANAKAFSRSAPRAISIRCASLIAGAASTVELGLLAIAWRV
jgi:hypothetical protein